MPKPDTQNFIPGRVLTLSIEQVFREGEDAVVVGGGEKNDSERKAKQDRDQKQATGLIHRHPQRDPRRQMFIG